MRAGLIIICCLIFLTGCKNKNKIPDGIIPQKKMQAVMWDMMRADQFLADFVLNKDTGIDKTSEKIRLYRKVFVIHNISQEQFDKSFSYYKTHPVLFKAIMDSLSQPRPETPADTVKQSVRPDSIPASVRTNSKVDSLKRFRKKKFISVE